jgi:tryptophan synthase alpha chain
MFMTYLNPLLSYGYERFFKRCSQTGISGIIIPDMPFEEQCEIKEFTDKYGITVINLIAPTSEERVNILPNQAKGFIYLVSSLGVTGTRNRITTDISAIVSKIKKSNRCSDRRRVWNFSYRTGKKYDKMCRRRNN